MDTAVKPNELSEISRDDAAGRYCEKCRNTGVLLNDRGGVYLCDCKEAEYKGRYISRLPVRFRAAYFVNGTLYVDNKPVAPIEPYEAKFVENPGLFLLAGHGITYQGPVGTGKTTRAAALCRAAIDRLWRLKPNIRFYGEVELQNWLRQEALGELTGFSQRVIEADLVVIDDLGKKKASDFVEEKLFEIIDGRYARQRSTIITTNLTPPKLAERFPNVGEFIISRLAEVNLVVELNGSDNRR